MKILVVCQHYWPENFRVTEICEALVERGHQVTALVGLPNYPTGHIPDEYKGFRNRKQIHNGVEIIRCFEVGRKPGKIGLAINYVSYMLSASIKALLLKRDYDVVYSFSTSPVLMSFPAALLRCITKKKFLIYILDHWPTCLAAMDVYEGSLLYTIMKPVSKWIYSKADIVTYSSKGFQNRLKNIQGMDVPDEWYMPQFADDVFEEPLIAKKATEEKQLVFAGNIGKVQAVEVIIEAANLLREEPVHWHIVGDGTNHEECMELASKLQLDEKITFYGRRPLEEMPSFFAMADAMIASIRNNISANDTLPGKVQTYMAAGKPVLGSSIGEMAYIINDSKCGLCAPSDNPEAFADIVRQFLRATPEEIEAMGKAGYQYYQKHFTKKLHMDRLEAMLLELAKNDS